MHLKSVWTLAAGVVLLSIAGCGKKEKLDQDAGSGADVPSVNESAVEDTSFDVFDEFFDDSKDTAAGMETADDFSSGETFSTASESYQPSFDPNGRYVVQVSCVRYASFGEKLVDELEAKGFPAYLAEVANPTPSLPGVYYRVRIGGFTGVSDARAIGENVLLPQGYEYWVDNRSNDNVGMEGYGLGEPAPVESYESGYSEPAISSPAPTYESADDYQETAPASDDSWGTGTETATETESFSEPAPPAPATQPETTQPATEPAAPPPAPTTDQGQTTDDGGWGDDDWGDDEWGSESGW